MSFNVALTGLNAANQDLSVTSNNLANSATVGFKGSRAEFGDMFAATADRRVLDRRGQRRHGPGSRPAVHARATSRPPATTSTSPSAATASSPSATTARSPTPATASSSSTTPGRWSPPPARTCRSIRRCPTAASTPAACRISLSRRTRARRKRPRRRRSPRRCRRTPRYRPTTTFSPVRSDELHRHDLAHGLRLAGRGAHRVAVLHQGRGRQRLVGADLCRRQRRRHAAGPPVFDLRRADQPAQRPGHLAGLHAGHRRRGHEHDVQFQPDAADRRHLRASRPYSRTASRPALSPASTSTPPASCRRASRTAARWISARSRWRTSPTPRACSSTAMRAGPPTTASGSAVQGVAGGSGFGSIQSGSLEESNVDTTSALVDMITAQRDFQANAQMIQTAGPDHPDHHHRAPRTAKARKRASRPWTNCSTLRCRVRRRPCAPRPRTTTTSRTRARPASRPI